jgi:hypothetical protein
MRRPVQHGDVVVLEMTGDSDALEFGGGVVFRKDGQIYWQFWDAPTGRKYLIWTSKIPFNVLRQFSFVDREGIARFLRIDLDELRGMSVSNRIMDRQRLVEVIGETEGWSTICPDDVEDLVRWELIQRWGPLLGVDPETAPRMSPGDCLICESDEGFVCGRVGGEFFGLYERLEGCASAVAEALEGADPSSLVFVESAPGEIERLEWTRSKWLGRERTKLRIGFSSARWRFRMRPYLRESQKKLRALTRGQKAVKTRFRGRLSRT